MKHNVQKNCIYVKQKYFVKLYNKCFDCHIYNLNMNLLKYNHTDFKLPIQAAWTKPGDCNGSLLCYL